MVTRYSRHHRQPETRTGRALELGLVAIILLSTLAAMLESVASIREQHNALLKSAEILFTAVFTVEYIIRLYTARNRRAYALSFFGLVDLVSFLPTYLGLLFYGARYLRVVKTLRLLRIFRILKLTSYLGEIEILRRSLLASTRKILVFLTSVLFVVVVIGTLMYVIEGADSGFMNIPRSIYWTIVTITTVGYGDIAPQTAAGQFIAALVMLLGYSIIAVPTGIVTVELARAARRPGSARGCPQCATADHAPDARYCRICGAALPQNEATGSNDPGGTPCNTIQN